MTVAVFAEGDKAREAEAAGADFVGSDDLAKRIQDGFTDFDVAIATPDMMGTVGRLGRILGPSGKMPNPKSGTVTFDIGKAVGDVKAGKVEYRTDRTGIVHIGIGKRSFEERQLIENYQAVIEEIVRVKPAASKGRYLKSITIAQTMGPGIPIDTTRVSQSDVLEEPGLGARPHHATEDPRGRHRRLKPPASRGPPCEVGERLRGPSGTPAPARPHGSEQGGDPLRRDEKEAAIAALSERLAASDTIFAADYRGLTVKQMAELRGAPAGGRDRVHGRQEHARAARGGATGRDALLAYLDGPTAIAWVGGDAAVAAKALNGYATEHPNALSVKGGLLEGADLPSADVVRLARLPSREQLLAQLAGGVAAPLSGLAGSLSNLIGGLARSLAALQAQRGDEAPASTD